MSNVTAKIIFLTGLAVLVSSQKNLRAPSTGQAIIVNSNVGQATILKNGFFLGNAGQSLDINTGVHELVVTSPGFVPRLIRVNIAQAKKTVLVVNLQKTPNKRSIDTDDFEAAWKFEAKRSIVDLKSLCQQVLPSTFPSDTRRFNGRCNRRSWFDDIEYAGGEWLRRPDFTGLDEQSVKVFSERIFTSNQASKDLWNQTAEGHFALWPGQELIYALLAKSSLMRQDCGRVYQILHEHGMHGVMGVSLRAVASHCMELEGSDDQAINLLRQAEKNNFPEAMYHIARILYGKNPASAVKTLTSCTKNHPTFFPCAEVLAMHFLKNGRSKLAGIVFDKYDEAVKRIVSNFFDGIYKNSDTFSYAKRLSMLRKAKASAPYSYTLAWELLLTIGETKELGPEDFRAHISQVHLSDLNHAKRLISRIRKLNKSEYLEDLFWHFTETYPRNPIFWLKLAQIQKRKGGCESAMPIIEKGLRQKLKSRKGMMSLKGDCLLALGKYELALKVFTQSVKDDPDNWKPFWNLGIVYEEMGQMQKSIYYFRESLIREPPETYNMQLMRKIEYLERVKANE